MAGFRDLDIRSQPKDISGSQLANGFNRHANHMLSCQRSHPNANGASLTIEEGALNHPRLNKKIHVDLVTADSSNLTSM